MNRQESIPQQHQEKSMPRRLMWSSLLLWVKPAIGLCFVIFGAYCLWDSIIHFGNYIWPPVWVAVAIVFCCIWTYLFVMFYLETLLFQDLLDMRFTHMATISARIISILGRSPLVRQIWLSFIENYLGLANLCLGSFDNAELHFKNALARLAKASNRIRPALQAAYILPLRATLIVNLASTCARLGNLQEAMRLVQEELNLLSANETKSWHHLYSALLLSALSSFYLKLNELNNAEECLLKANNCFTQLIIPKLFSWSPAVRLSKKRIGSLLYLRKALLYARKQNAEESRLQFKNFLIEAEQNTANIAPLAIGELCLLANEFILVNYFAEAEAALNFAYAICKQCPQLLDSEDTLTTFEKLLVSTERQSEVASMRLWLRPVTLSGKE